MGPHLKLLRFDEANISAARNLGIAASAGEVVAFIDDDAVPEPLWLWHLGHAFSDPDVGAATGFTRNWDGVRFQAQAAMAWADATTRPFPLATTEPVVVAGRNGKGVKTEGTNMAFRRDLLLRMGGFDPGFRFYLDETDLNLRLAAEGVSTAIAPLAEVHHHQAASARRNPDRAPRDLFEVGASLSLFLRRHAGRECTPPLLADARDAQRKRLIADMVRGLLDPLSVPHLLRRFDAGVADGSSRSTEAPPRLTPAPEAAAFKTLPLPPKERTGTILSGWLQRRRGLRATAARAVANSATPVTLLLWSRNAWRHRVQFRVEGYWEHRRGIFESRPRDAASLRNWRFLQQEDEESSRIHAIRHAGLD